MAILFTFIEQQRSNVSEPRTRLLPLEKIHHGVVLCCNTTSVIKFTHTKGKT